MKLTDTNLFEIIEKQEQEIKQLKEEVKVWETIREGDLIIMSRLKQKLENGYLVTLESEINNYQQEIKQLKNQLGNLEMYHDTLKQKLEKIQTLYDNYWKQGFIPTEKLKGILEEK